MGLIKGYISQQVVDECRKNLLKKLPEALPVFEKVILHSLKVVKTPSQKDIAQYTGMAHPKDVSILTAAIKLGAQYLVTFNTKDYYPEGEIGLDVLEPGELLQKIRKRLSELAE
ncbi:MAG: hypothetical protein D6732_18945 [Methanobacteriota archaeon]|nr:MAG: hypothetical protein D6732_18945 [Euryarchaeota archaeon]